MQLMEIKFLVVLNNVVYWSGTLAYYVGRRLHSDRAVKSGGYVFDNEYQGLNQPFGRRYSIILVTRWLHSDNIPDLTPSHGGAKPY